MKLEKDGALLTICLFLLAFPARGAPRPQVVQDICMSCNGVSDVAFGGGYVPGQRLIFTTWYDWSEVAFLNWSYTSSATEEDAFTTNPVNSSGSTFAFVLDPAGNQVVNEYSLRNLVIQNHREFAGLQSALYGSSQSGLQVWVYGAGNSLSYLPYFKRNPFADPPIFPMRKGDFPAGQQANLYDGAGFSQSYNPSLGGGPVSTKDPFDFKQDDLAWSSAPYGLQPTTKTIGGAGCALTCLTNVYNFYMRVFHGANVAQITPVDFQDKLLQHNPVGFDLDSSSGQYINIKWDVARRVIEKDVNRGPFRLEYYEGHQAAALYDARAALRTCENVPVLVHVLGSISGGSSASTSGHWVLAKRSILENNSHRITINDPAHGATRLDQFSVRDRVYSIYPGSWKSVTPGYPGPGSSSFPAKPGSAQAMASIPQYLHVSVSGTGFSYLLTRTSDGKRVGHDPSTGIDYFEIPGVTYGPRPPIEDISSGLQIGEGLESLFGNAQGMSGAYDLDITASSAITVSITATASNNDGDMAKAEVTSIILAAGQTASFVMTYACTAPQSGVIALN